MDDEEMTPKFIACVRLIFESTKIENNMLRKVAMDLVERHLETLWNIEAFQDLVRGGGDFAVDIFTRLIGRD